MASRTFEVGAGQVGVARHFARTFLRGDPRAEDAGLIVSELATNAVRHAGSPFTVTLVLDGRLRLEVHDELDRLPVVRTVSPDDVSGRGLQIVETVASAWGSRLVSGGGKVVWAELDAVSASPPRTATTTDAPRRSTR